MVEEIATQLVSDKQQFSVGRVDDGEAERAPQGAEIGLPVETGVEYKLLRGRVFREIGLLAEVTAVGQHAMEGANDAFRGGDRITGHPPSVSMAAVACFLQALRHEFEGGIAEMKITGK